MTDEHAGPKARNEILYRYFSLEDAERWSFNRTGGIHCEGYTVEVEAGRVLFHYGGPLAPDEPEWIAFESVSVIGLRYWSGSEQCWLDLTLD